LAFASPPAQKPLHVCEKCGYSGPTARHEGCNYLAPDPTRVYEDERRKLVATALAEQRRRLLGEAIDVACSTIASLEGSECDHDPRHRTIFDCLEVEVAAAIRRAEKP
jgi:hypothetical protein